MLRALCAGRLRDVDVTNLINNRRLKRALYTFLLANQRNKGFFHDFAGDLLYEDYMVTVISIHIINYSTFRRDWKILTGSFHCSFNLTLPNETIAINNNNNNKNKDHNNNSNNNNTSRSRLVTLGRATSALLDGSSQVHTGNC